jgi:hypothetical protein
MMTSKVRVIPFTVNAIYVVLFIYSRHWILFCVRDKYIKKTILYRNQKNNRSQINVRENRRDGQEWTIQRHMNDWVHKTLLPSKLILPYAYMMTIVNVYFFFGEHIDNVIYYKITKIQHILLYTLTYTWRLTVDLTG